MIRLGLAGCALLGLAACVSTPNVAAEAQPLLTNTGHSCPEDAAERRIVCRTKVEWRMIEFAEDETTRAQARRDMNALNTPAAKPQYTPRYAKGF